jgi:hypothetical protein
VNRKIRSGASDAVSRHQVINSITDFDHGSGAAVTKGRWLVEPAAHGPCGSKYSVTPSFVYYLPKEIGAGLRFS